MNKSTSAENGHIQRLQHVQVADSTRWPGMHSIIYIYIMFKLVIYIMFKLVLKSYVQIIYMRLWHTDDTYITYMESTSK